MAQGPPAGGLSATAEAGNDLVTTVFVWLWSGAFSVREGSTLLGKSGLGRNLGLDPRIHKLLIVFHSQPAPFVSDGANGSGWNTAAGHKIWVIFVGLFYLADFPPPPMFVSHFVLQFNRSGNEAAGYLKYFRRLIRRRKAPAAG